MHTLTPAETPPAAPVPPPRKIVYRTRGQGHGGPITRLMSPSDLGQMLKPFVFLDIFDAGGPMLQAMAGMPLHPHSGIATVTVLTKGSLRYDDPANGTGLIEYGGVEWMRAGVGVWHGKEMTLPPAVQHVQGFQLWLALPATLEVAAPQSHYLEARHMAQAGPAHVVIGEYAGVRSPVDAPAGVNYLLVTLRPGEQWVYQPPPGHTTGWLALASGALDAGPSVVAGELVVFAGDGAPVVLAARGDEDAVFVLGSAIPHPHELHLGNYSVHTSAKALATGEQRIAELGQQLKSAGDRSTSSGTIPVYR
jgi:redox-sensitive bicupin YhaK (pirin superfamily)